MKSSQCWDDLGPGDAPGDGPGPGARRPERRAGEKIGVGEKSGRGVAAEVGHV